MVLSDISHHKSFVFCQLPPNSVLDLRENEKKP